MVVTLNKTYLEYIFPYFEEINYIFAKDGTPMIRAGGFFGDPNYCALFLLLTLAILCTLYYHKQIKTEFWLLFVPIAALGFFTYSKSYFLCFAALILFLIIFVLFPKHKVWATLSIIALGALLVLVFSGKIETVNIIFDRFKEEDLTTGRLELNRIYLDYIWKNPVTMFFGEGLGAPTLDRGHIVHNLYIESLFSFGMVGCGLYLLVLGLGIGTLKAKSQNVASCLPMIFVMVMYFFLAGITSYELAFYIAIAFLTLKPVNATVESTDTK